MMQGQEYIITSEKQLSDLAHITYDILQQKVRIAMTVVTKVKLNNYGL